MGQTYNIYCDESCHLENDRLRVMVLGAVWCPESKVREVAVRLREIKARHELKPGFELKWTKVSPAKVQFYLDMVDYFFDDDDLHFRALVVPDKGLLRHDDYVQDHDSWYYKMYFLLIKAILAPHDTYHVYLDIKDTRSADKVRKLHDVLRNSVIDWSPNIVQRVQTVRSHEVELLQLTDLLIGAISYVNRGLDGNAGKLRLIERIRQRSGYDLTKTTLMREEKVNILRWQAGAPT